MKGVLLLGLPHGSLYDQDKGSKLFLHIEPLFILLSRRLPHAVPPIPGMNGVSSRRKRISTSIRVPKVNQQRCWQGSEAVKTPAGRKWIGKIIWENNLAIRLLITHCIQWGKRNNPSLYQWCNENKFLYISNTNNYAIVKINELQLHASTCVHQNILFSAKSKKT